MGEAGTDGTIGMDELTKLIRQEVEKSHSGNAKATNDAVRAAPPAQPHNVRRWEKKCRDCGEENKDYKVPTSYCKTCHIPLGDDDLGTADKPCTNCGGTVARDYPED